MFSDDALGRDGVFGRGCCWVGVIESEVEGMRGCDGITMWRGWWDCWGYIVVLDLCIRMCGIPHRYRMLTAKRGCV